jgi:hypothetical protein
MSDSGIDSDIVRDVGNLEEDIDRNAGYEHEAASGNPSPSSSGSTDSSSPG